MPCRGEGKMEAARGQGLSAGPPARSGSGAQISLCLWE